MRSVKFLLMMMLLGGLPTVFAADVPAPLNVVQCQLSAEAWAQTTTAKVTVNVDATLNDSDLAKTQAAITDRLQKISDAAPWHVTQFNRHQDASGLERVNIRAEARLPEKALPKLRARAQSLSRAGEKYKIIGIEFKPSLSDLEKTRAEVRQAIYKMADAELTRLNAVYPNQHFVLHQLHSGGPAIVQASQHRQEKVMAYRSLSSAADSNLSVSDKVVMTATVIYATHMLSRDN